MDGMSAVADEREYWILCYNDGNYIVAFNRAFFVGKQKRGHNIVVAVIDWAFYDFMWF